MRIGPIIAGGILLAANAAAAASADYYLKIEGVGRESAAGSIYLKVSSTGDLDGDGLPDAAVVRLTCAGETLRAADYRVTGPRDPVSGQASGKRMHKPFAIVKEWGAASPQLMAMKTGYDIKKVEGTGARAGKSAEDDWTAITLSNAGGLCAAAAGAVRKTRSNIQNN